MPEGRGAELVLEGLQLYRDVERLDLLLARRSRALEKVVRRIQDDCGTEDWARFLEGSGKIRREFDQKREMYLGPMSEIELGEH